MNTRRDKWITAFFFVGLAIVLTMGIGYAQGVGGWVSVQGTLAQYAPAAGNRVNAFFLDDGSEVHFPAQEYSKVDGVVKKGDQVKVTGSVYVGPVGDVHIYASTITNPTTGATITITMNAVNASTGSYSTSSKAAYPPSTAYQTAQTNAWQQPMTSTTPLTVPYNGASAAVPATGYQPGLPMAYAPVPSALPVPPAPPAPGPLGSAAPAPSPAAPPALGITGVGGSTATSTQISTLSGVVRGFMYGAAGEVGGFLLSTTDGTTITVQVAPEISPWIPTVAAMGTSVKVTGWMNIGPAGERMLVATSVQNTKTGETVGSVSQATGSYPR